MKTIIIITLIYFFAGAVLLCFYKKEGKLKWLKYFVYMAIVAIMMLLLYYECALYVFSVIVLYGLYEIFNLVKTKLHINYLLIMILIYAVMSFSLLILSTYFNSYFVVKFYCIIFTFDGFSQLGGQLFGKHKLIRKISPNKTIEGLFIGTCSAILTALILFNESIIVAVGFAICVSLFALIGDLVASWYKRKIGVKDYNNLLPGHGGLLDRFDSLLGGSIGVWVYFYLCNNYINGSIHL